MFDKNTTTGRRALWDFPFFEPRHRALAEALSDWPMSHEETHDMGATCRAFARELGDRGLLVHVVPEEGTKIDVRALCVIREAFGYRDFLVDSVFAMQGIGTGAIWMHGTQAQKDRYLDPARRGERIAAFALSEPEAGSDVASMITSATLDDDDYVLNGEKTWITNAGFADHYIVVARTGEAPAPRA